MIFGEMEDMDGKWGISMKWRVWMGVGVVDKACVLKCFKSLKN